MSFKRSATALAALVLLATTASAQAADPRGGYGPPPGVSYYSWSGFYAGVNGGYGWGSSTWDGLAVAPDPSGAMVGGQIGYSLQMGGFVVGIEGDFDWADLKGGAGCGAFVCDTRNTWLATVRGRLGYAFDRFMPYLTAGGAYGHLEAVSTNPAAFGVSTSELGWTVGIGLEYAFAGGWSAKVEYLYVDLGDFDCSTACAAGTNHVSFDAGMFRAGLNYRFFGPILRRW